MKSKNVMIAILTMALSISAWSAPKAGISALKTQIAERTKQLGELKNSIREARVDGGRMTVKLSQDGAKLLLVGGGAIYLNRLEKAGTGPFARYAARLEKLNPNTGVILGPLPRAIAKDVAIIGTKVAGISTQLGGAVWSITEAVYATKDAAYLTLDTAQVVWLEAQIQYAQERLTSAAADLDAITRSFE